MSIYVKKLKILTMDISSIKKDKIYVHQDEIYLGAKLFKGLEM